jgi:O-antigen/teichoic acid export membrane protein
VLGNAVYAGCQWAMLVALAKLGSRAMVGQFVFGLAVTAPVFIFANLQLRTVQATDARREYRFGHYLALRLTTTGLALLFLVGLLLAGGYPAGAAPVILVIGLAKAFESVSEAYYGLLQQHERMERIAKSLMLRGPLSVLALAGGVYLTGSVLGGVIGLAAAWALLLALYDAPSGAWLQRLRPAGRPEGLAPCWEWPALARLAWLALPLGVVMMLFSLNANIPRYFVEHYLGEEDLAVFAAMAYLMMVGNQVVTNSLGQSASARLARYYAAGDRRAFWRLVGQLLAFGAALGVAGVLVAWVAGREILTLLYRPEYAEQPGVFTLLMVAAGLGYITSMLAYAATGARRMRSQTVALVAMTLATLLSGMVLVKSHHLAGAAVSTIIASAVGVIAFAWVLLRKERG